MTEWLSFIILAMSRWLPIIIVLVLALIIVFWVVGIYNGLVSLRNRFKNAFAQIDVQLKRRHDLIPNLVETAKGYMSHERETLEAVIQARSSAANARSETAKTPDDPESMKRLLAAEAGLSGALGKLFALSEAYPDLKANQNMMQLSEELTSTENKIAFARQAYNDAVMAYNIKRESFPDNMIAGSFSFKPAQLWEMDDETHRDPVQVTF